MSLTPCPGCGAPMRERCPACGSPRRSSALAPMGGMALVLLGLTGCSGDTANALYGPPPTPPDPPVVDEPEAAPSDEASDEVVPDAIPDVTPGDVPEAAEEADADDDTEPGKKKKAP